MQIDGYTPPDKTIETEVGIKLIYKVNLDSTSETFTFNALSAGRSNTALKIAADQKSEVRALAKRTGVTDENDDSNGDVTAIRDAVELLHDHVVTSWSTTLTQKGKVIKSTRQNFIALLTMEKFEGLFVKLTKDTSDMSKFTREVEDADAKK